MSMTHTHPAPRSAPPHTRISAPRWGEIAGKIALVITLVAMNLIAGFSAASHSAYWSEAQVFHSFMNSPLRIVLPIAVALLAGAREITEISHRFAASTRTREDVRHRTARRLTSEAAQALAIFGGLAVVNVVAAWVVVPAIWPTAIDPASAGLTTEAAVHAADVDVSPLTAALSHGPVVFALVTAMWLGLNAAALALITVSAVHVIGKPLLALFVPFAIYLGESIVTQLAGVPGSSFLISMIYPSGLQHYSLAQAMIPSAILLVIAVGGAVTVTLLSRRNNRLA